MRLHTNSRGLPGILYADSFESNLSLDENVSINFVKFKKGLYRIKDIKVISQFVVALKERLGRQGVKSRELANKLSLQEKAIHRKDQEMLDLEMEITMLKDKTKILKRIFSRCKYNTGNEEVLSRCSGPITWGMQRRRQIFKST